MACHCRCGSYPSFSTKKSLIIYGLFEMVSLTRACRINWVMGSVRILERREAVLSNSVTPFFIQTKKNVAKNKGRF